MSIERVQWSFSRLKQMDEHTCQGLVYFGGFDYFLGEKNICMFEVYFVFWGGKNFYIFFTDGIFSFNFFSLDFFIYRIF
jgi:hypothetical protein